MEQAGPLDESKLQNSLTRKSKSVVEDQRRREMD
jgi:hypothetical protein